MLRKKFTNQLIALTLIVSFAAESQAAKPVALLPISPWNVDWSETTCTMRRMFGSKESPSLVMLERFGPSDRFQLVISSPEFKGFQVGTQVRLRFGSADPRPVMTVMPGKAANGTPSLFLGSQSLSPRFDDELAGWSPAVTPALEAATNKISVIYLGKERTFVTGPLDKAFDAMRTCTDNLVAHWGLDPKQQGTLSKRATPLSSPATWLRQTDYPADMANRGKQGLVNFRLAIDAQGSPKACEVQRSYNDKKFDEVTCAVIMRRARFSPALDAEGQATASYFVSQVRWVMGW